MTPFLQMQDLQLMPSSQLGLQIANQIANLHHQDQLAVALQQALTDAVSQILQAIQSPAVQNQAIQNPAVQNHANQTSVAVQQQLPPPPSSRKDAQMQNPMNLDPLELLGQQLDGDAVEALQHSSLLSTEGSIMTPLEMPPQELLRPSSFLIQPQTELQAHAAQDGPDSFLTLQAAQMSNIFQKQAVMSAPHATLHQMVECLPKDMQALQADCQCQFYQQNPTKYPTL